MATPVKKRDLSLCNFILAMDRSGSMSDIKRWQKAQEIARSFAVKAAKYDEDGIDLLFFNNVVIHLPNIKPDQIGDIFDDERYEPSNGTNLFGAIQKGIEIHRNAVKETGKKTIFIVVTDGEPSEDYGTKKQIAKLILDQANSQESDADFTILFLQVGDDKAATAFLKALDDDLQKAGAKFDIIDCKTSEEISNKTITEVLQEAI